jgi:hypothetical protein
MGAVGRLGRLTWPSHGQMMCVDGSYLGSIWENLARTSSKDARLRCLSIAVEGTQYVAVFARQMLTTFAITHCYLWFRYEPVILPMNLCFSFSGGQVGKFIAIWTARDHPAWDHSTGVPNMSHSQGMTLHGCYKIVTLTGHDIARVL